MSFQKTIKIVQTGSTKFKNYNLIRREEVKVVEQTVIECLEQYGLYNTGSVSFEIGKIEISKRLKTTAGNCRWKPISNDGHTFDINLAYNNYVEFGFESMVKTLRHEMAHLIEKVLYGKSGHSERFKRICVALGGHMNTHLAGSKYSDSATKDYCKRKPSKKIKYTCECGAAFIRTKRIVKNAYQLRCRRCRLAVAHMKMEVIE